MALFFRVGLSTHGVSTQVDECVDAATSDRKIKVDRKKAEGDGWHVLRQLWQQVVHPIINALGIQVRG